MSDEYEKRWRAFGELYLAAPGPIPSSRETTGYYEYEMDAVRAHAARWKALAKRLHERLEFAELRAYDAEAHSTAFYADAKQLTAERDRALARVGELLALVAKVSQETPLPDEVASSLNQRGVLLAEIGTLRAEVERLRAELEQLNTAYFEHGGPVEQMRTNDHLRAALRRYGRHEQLCATRSSSIYVKRGGCNCGFQEALGSSNGDGGEAG